MQLSNKLLDFIEMLRSILYTHMLCNIEYTRFNWHVLYYFDNFGDTIFFFSNSSTFYPYF